MADRIDLPIDDVLAQVVETLNDHGALVLKAPAGAGKTTRVPPAVLDGCVGPGDGRVLVLEPRRVAARATARRIAHERGVRLGDEVGYQVRFDRRMSDRTRLAIITEGILTRRLQSDPLLDGVAAVVLDEFHERSIHTDLAIAFLKELRQVRDDLKVVVMSATLQTGPIAEYLGCRSVESAGRTFPVETHYLDQPTDDYEAEAARVVGRVLADADDDGDILVFMPGAGSIHRTIGAIRAPADVEVLPLYGALKPAEQDRAIAPAERRRVIVSTNIAETSLTIEGVTSVIDSGRVKQLEMNPQSGLDRLVETQISVASADQRAGRAGRVRPGRCYRLWTHASEHRMALQDTPEIQRVDVTAPILEVLAWSGADPSAFDWYQAPPEHAIERAVELLRRLHAIEADGFVLTDTGRELLELPAHPRIGRMLVEGARRGVVDEAAAMGAILSERDFVQSVADGAPGGDSDLLRRAEVLDEAAAGREQGARSLGMRVHVGGARRVKRVRDQLRRLLSSKAGGPGSTDDALKALAVGYPDRICLKRGGDDAESRRYVMVGGEPLALAWESIVREAEIVVAPEIAGQTRGRDTGAVISRGLIRLASRLERAWLDELFADRLVDDVEVRFDWERERVMAVRRELFDGLTLDEAVVSVQEHAEPAAVADLLAEAAAQDLERAFGLSAAQAQVLDRLRCLGEWMPELEVPVLSPEDAGFRQTLRQIVWGKRSFDELRRTDFIAALKGYLDHRQIQALEEMAPPRYTAPSGKTHRIHYEPGGPPVLEVRIQEMFGLRQTPRVAGGRIPVVLHLLAPNFRPAQVTQDLASFWENTYPEVRKELRARYSKHPWPEDPLTAKPVAK